MSTPAPRGAERRPRRILVVTDEMEVGGSQRQITYLLAGLDRSRWEPELLYFRRRSFLVDELEAHGVRTHHLPKRGRVDAAFVRGLRARLAEGRYELVHAFSLTAELWVRALLPFVPATRFVASVRGLCLGYPRWQWWLKRWILHRADAVVANAQAGACTTAERTGFARARIDVIPNGVETPAVPAPAERVERRAELGVPLGRAFGLFVGRLVVEKNLPLLLDALARIAAPERPLLLLAGDGPLREDLQARVRALGLDGDVRLLGERRDAQALMPLADFLALPSREEGLSNVLLEAMAAGCPVLASAVGGNPELVTDGVTGLLFRSDDAPALAGALARLATDADLRARLGEAARRQAATTYSIAELVASTDALYARLLGAEPPSRSAAARITGASLV